MPGVSSTSIVDNACGYAALTRSPPGCEIETAEFKTNFVRPAIGARFPGRGPGAERGAHAHRVHGQCVRLRAMGRSTSWWPDAGHHGQCPGERLTTNRSAIAGSSAGHLVTVRPICFSSQ